MTSDNPAVPTYMGLTPPENPTPGTRWIQIDPDDADHPMATGNVYEWTED